MDFSLLPRPLVMTEGHALNLGEGQGEILRVAPNDGEALFGCDTSKTVTRPVAAFGITRQT